MYLLYLAQTNWDQIRSSFLQAGSQAPGLTGPQGGRGGASELSAAEPSTMSLTVTNLVGKDVIIEETSGSDEKIELPKSATATVSLKMSPDLKSLHFKSTAKDDGEQFYMNGEKDLEVDPKSLPPIFVHKQGKISDVSLQVNLFSQLDKYFC